ncbi:hypothetical protein PU629_17640 [Pullulanibacillus sp. KACC 23026]|uniref:hypothetical protein n=1 Tax=Pullulanibacillus sp. KACC 23026 TaxID=3028315 RepID=UPI0023B0A85D|nr:hypothetical protein [Pullulanibacillus sp. KACC 23026]WEG11930.1 hypothetical protein PU629_17640 [Pullulanibacillus sp. KACC 23026]
MIVRVLFLFIGFGLAVAGGVTLIAFLNLLTMGHTAVDYFHFVVHRPESYLFVGGLLLMWLSLYFPSI